MQKTKYVEIKPSEKLPTEKGEYIAVIDPETNFAGFFSFDPEDPEDVKWWKETPEYWLLEVKDNEDELRNMIDELIWELRNTEEPGRHTEMIDKANSLLTKIK